jgi:hypothetical protein
LQSTYAWVILTFILLLCSKCLKYNLKVEFIWCYLFAREDTKTNVLFVLNNNKCVTNTTFHLTLYTFSFEINESRLSDTRCLIQDVVSPHCGDKRMARRCTRRSLPNYVDMTSYHWNVRQNTVTWRWWMNGKNNVTSYTKCSPPQSIVHILIQPLLLA